MNGAGFRWDDRLVGPARLIAEKRSLADLRMDSMEGIS